MVDTNNNGVSDIWEKTYNNEQLFTTFDPNADPDGDGWTNAREAIAGTDPFNPTPAIGFPQPDLTHIAAVYGVDENNAPVLQTPEGFFVHWGTEIGKQYTLFGSPDLSPGSWFPIDDPIVAMNREMQIGLSPAYTDGSLPPILFWRTAVNDVDSDGDGFTNYEEYLMHTNPEIADHDADGLPDLWEIFYGLDPNDDGSIDPDNGPNGDADTDGFFNLTEYLGGSNPIDAASTPPASSTPSTTIGTPPLLLSESVTGYGYKYGFQGFIPYQGEYPLYHRYLHRDFYRTSDDTDNDGDGGSTHIVENINPQTGEITGPEPVITGDGGADYSNGLWDVLDDANRSRNGTDSDGSGESSSITETLSNEYTTPLFTAYVESQMPAYTGTFSEFNDPSASIALIHTPAEYADSYYLTTLKYKWEAHKHKVLEGENVNWLEVFTPADGTPPLIEPMKWNNILGQPTSQTYSIDPSEKNGGKNGTYLVVPVEFEVRHYTDIINGWDTTRGDDWCSVGVGKTSMIARLILDGISSEAAEKLELVVDPGSAAYVSLANNTITDQLTDFDIKGLKPTVTDSGCEIILRTKATKKTVTTLHVNVFEKIQVKVAIYTVHDSRQINTDVSNRAVLNPDIEQKLNEVYGPQANLNFTVDNTLSQDLDMGAHANDPVLFDSAGKFDYNSKRQNVIDKAGILAHVLPIFIVNTLLDSTKLGVTNSAQTDCFINNVTGCEVTAAHEAGHYYNLSQVRQGQANLHDMGPWPQELIDAFGTAKTGLLHETGGITVTNWLRQKDWIQANAKAKLKSK